MKISNDGKRLCVLLHKECTIMSVESDFDRIKEFLQEPACVEIDADDTVEIDTAYLQLLFSIKATADERGIAFNFVNPSEPLTGLLELYGLGTFHADRKDAVE